MTKLPILITHILSMAVGVGAATTTDYLFFRFLKDLRISKKEASVFNHVSKLIWIALTIAVITGAMLYIPQMEALNQAPKFVAKMLVVAVIILNGIFLHFYISPKLIHISFHERHRHEKGELVHWRKIAFASGAVSFTSWYSTVILALLPRDFFLGFPALISLYFAFVFCGIIGSQFLEHFFHWKGHGKYMKKKKGRKKKKRTK